VLPAPHKSVRTYTAPTGIHNHHLGRHIQPQPGKGTHGTKRRRRDTAGSVAQDMTRAGSTASNPMVVATRVVTMSMVLAQKIRNTEAFMFKEPNPLYTRHLFLGDNALEKYGRMELRCTQPECIWKKETANKLSGTNNWKTHYQQAHMEIPCDAAAEAIAIALEIENAGGALPFFAPRPPTTLNGVELHNAKFRKLILNYILKNNLAFSTVEQPEFEAIVEFLSPRTQQISRRTLMRDLIKEFNTGKDTLKAELQGAMARGARFALTTDAWSGKNRLDYIAVTIHYRDTDGQLIHKTLDIMELTNPSHTGAYLCKQLLRALDSFGITKACMAITRDNASVNDVMLKELQAQIEERYTLLPVGEQCQYCLTFNTQEGDVRCCAHVYNIAVNAGMYDLS